MKGYRKLEIKDPVETPYQKRLEVRDKHLAIRFYFHSYIRKQRLDAVYNKLSDEFYLAEKTIIDKLMTDCSPTLDELNRNRPKLSELAEMIPNMKF